MARPNLLNIKKIGNKYNRSEIIIRFKYFLFFLTFFFNIGCYTVRENILINGLTTGQFEQINALVVYNDSNLFDFMNGEAETYLKYGFKYLYVQKYQVIETGAEIVLETYDMGTEKGAGDIFSIYTQGQGTFINDLGECAWTDDYLVLFVRHEYFSRIWPEPLSDRDLGPKTEDLFNLGRSMDLKLKTMD